MITPIKIVMTLSSYLTSKMVTRTATLMQIICLGLTPETGHGIVTDVCIKRKIRNYVETVKEGVEGYEIYIKENIPLNRSDLRAINL